MATSFKSRLEITPSSSNPSLATQILFDAEHVEPDFSPINQFMERLHAINKLAPHPVTFDPLQGQLVLLGVIAAVESFMRTLFRKIITTDAIAKQHAYKKDISYAAALHLDRDMLPEAILERISFISYHSIIETIKDLAGIKGAVPTQVEVCIKDYVKICHLRHCTVHRFGRLGASNAVALGIENHKDLLEKPLTLDYTSLQTAILICTTFVKTINNHLFNELLSRIPESEWVKKYSADKKNFDKYYDLFSDSVSIQAPSIKSRPMYALFIGQLESHRASENGAA